MLSVAAHEKANTEAASLPSGVRARNEIAVTWMI